MTVRESISQIGDIETELSVILAASKFSFLWKENKSKTKNKINGNNPIKLHSCEKNENNQKAVGCHKKA